MFVSQWDEGINGHLVFEVEDGDRIYYAQQLESGGFHVFRPLDGTTVQDTDKIAETIRAYMEKHNLPR